jgi:hypothetical protein
LPKKGFLPPQKTVWVISQQKNGHPHESRGGHRPTGGFALGLQKKVDLTRMTRWPRCSPNDNIERLQRASHENYLFFLLFFVIFLG